MGDAGGQKHALPKSTDFEDPPLNLRASQLIPPLLALVDSFPAFLTSYLYLSSFETIVFKLFEFPKA